MCDHTVVTTTPFSTTEITYDRGSGVDLNLGIISWTVSDAQCPTLVYYIQGAGQIAYDSVNI